MTSGRSTIGTMASSLCVQERRKVVRTMSRLLACSLVTVSFVGCGPKVTTRMTTFTDPAAKTYHRIMVKSDLPKISHRSLVESVFAQKLKGEVRVVRAVDRPRNRIDAILHVTLTGYYEEDVFIPAQGHSSGRLFGSLYSFRGYYDSSYVGAHTVYRPTVRHHLELVDENGFKAWVGDSRTWGYASMKDLLEDLAKEARKRMKHVLELPESDEPDTGFVAEQTESGQGEESPSPWTEIRAGLSSKQVSAILGEPHSKSFGKATQLWAYPNRAFVRFSNGKVSTWAEETPASGSEDDYGFP